MRVACVNHLTQYVSSPVKELTNEVVRISYRKKGVLYTNLTAAEPEIDLLILPRGTFHSFPFLTERGELRSPPSDLHYMK